MQRCLCNPMACDGYLHQRGWGLPACGCAGCGHICCCTAGDLEEQEGEQPCTKFVGDAVLLLPVVVLVKGALTAPKAAWLCFPSLCFCPCWDGDETTRWLITDHSVSMVCGVMLSFEHQETGLWGKELVAGIPKTEQKWGVALAKKGKEKKKREIAPQVSIRRWCGSPSVGCLSRDGDVRDLGDLGFALDFAEGPPCSSCTFLFSSARLYLQWDVLPTGECFVRLNSITPMRRSDSAVKEDIKRIQVKFIKICVEL